MELENGLLLKTNKIINPQIKTKAATHTTANQDESKKGLKCRYQD